MQSSYEYEVQPGLGGWKQHESASYEKYTIFDSLTRRGLHFSDLLAESSTILPRVQISANLFLGEKGEKTYCLYSFYPHLASALA